METGYKVMNNIFNFRLEMVRLRKKMPHCGADRLRQEFGVKTATATIQKVVRQEDLSREKRSKRSKQRDLRAWKAANFKPLEYFQIDTRDCSAIPYYLERIRKADFPRWLYQTRDVRTGILFGAYASERPAHNSMLFVNRLFAHLQGLGMALSQVVVQVYYGSEFVNNSPYFSKRSAFENTLDQAQSRLVRIPPPGNTILTVSGLNSTHTCVTVFDLTAVIE